VTSGLCRTPVEAIKVCFPAPLLSKSPRLNANRITNSAVQPPSRLTMEKPILLGISVRLESTSFTLSKVSWSTSTATIFARYELLH
jgi:hypothetical protein